MNKFEMGFNVVYKSCNYSSVWLKYGLGLLGMQNISLIKEEKIIGEINERVSTFVEDGHYRSFSCQSTEGSLFALFPAICVHPEL